MAFSGSDSPKQQLLKAKAVSAENRELEELSKYHNARLRIAAGVRNPFRIANWDSVLAWLNREADETPTGFHYRRHPIALYVSRMDNPSQSSLDHKHSDDQPPHVEAQESVSRPR